MEPVVFSIEMLVVLGVLAIAVVLFVSEIVRLDVAAILIVALLGLLSLVPGLEVVTDPRDLFRGFGSNAVVSIIAVMMIGAGLDRAGVVSKIANAIFVYGGHTEGRLVSLTAGAVSAISGFMQNVGFPAVNWMYVGVAMLLLFGVGRILVWFRYR